VSIPANHPRYASLKIREHLVAMADEGLVDRTGLISQGRGEAFDYLMGECSGIPAKIAEKTAAAYLLKAENPVLCMNGNAVALDPQGLMKLAAAVPAKMEINVFHRREGRVEKLVKYMEEQGAKNVLGVVSDARIPGLSSDRALCTREGVFDSDVILVPIEDGDRAEALVAMGKKVISVDINPLSRTSKVSTVPISDEMSRAMANILEYVNELKGDDSAINAVIAGYSARNNRRDAIRNICDMLMSEFKEE